MLSICRSVHTLLLGFHPADRRSSAVAPPTPPASSHRCRSIPGPDDGGGGGLGLRFLASSSSSSSSSAAAPPPPPPSPSPSPPPPQPPRRMVEPSAEAEERVDAGARGLLEELDPWDLRLCTESLGSESCDGGEVMAEEEAAAEEEEEEEEERRGRSRMGRRGSGLRLGLGFPPPIPWVAGGRRRFMRATRGEGRVVITEVSIERPPEILRASRANGRLRLDLVADADPEAILDDGAASDADADAASDADADADAEEIVEEWGVGAVTRCQEAATSDGIRAWWGAHRCVTTA